MSQYVAFFCLVLVLSSSDSLCHENDILQPQMCLPSNGPTPIVIWHGMGDSCCLDDSMGRIQKILEENIPGIYVKSIKIGSNENEDLINSYLMDVNRQIEIVCRMLRNDHRLANGFNGLGFSQGGQFLRGIVQRCPIPPMKQLLTFGSQHQGIFGLPNCPGEDKRLCNLARKLLNIGAYNDYVQNHLVQAQYWHDPKNEAIYRRKSLFIGEINNEQLINQSYIDNFIKLDKFVMVQFMDDNVVDPQISESFGYFDEGQSTDVIEMKETRLYKEDRIGLRQLDEAGKVDVIRIPGNHLQIAESWFIREIIHKYLI